MGWQQFQIGLIWLFHIFMHFFRLCFVFVLMSKSYNFNPSLKTFTFFSIGTSLFDCSQYFSWWLVLCHVRFVVTIWVGSRHEAGMGWGLKKEIRNYAGQSGQVDSWILVVISLDWDFWTSKLTWCCICPGGPSWCPPGCGWWWRWPAEECREWVE